MGRRLGWQAGHQASEQSTGADSGLLDKDRAANFRLTVIGLRADHPLRNYRGHLMGKLKVRFLPEGGFDKNGAFIEYEGDAPNGDEMEYQRQWYLRLDIACNDLKVGTRFSVLNENEEQPERAASRAISAKGVIQPARWGRFSLSWLGGRQNTHEVSITIRENKQGETAAMGGLFIEKGDLDMESHDFFYLEVNMHPDRFAPLLKELTAPGANLLLSADVQRFRNFYAEWSPSVSDGRVIKFLDREQDVENADEIPEDFWRTPEFQRELVSNPDNPPVTISVGRPLQPLLPAPSTAEDDEDDWGIDEDTPASILQPIPTPVPNPIPALEELSKRLRQGAFWIGLWLALIFAILLLRK
jgi:hypothetical protein